MQLLLKKMSPTVKYHVDLTYLSLKYSHFSLRKYVYALPEASRYEYITLLHKRIDFIWITK